MEIRKSVGVVLTATAAAVAGALIAITPAQAAITGTRVVEFSWNAPNNQASIGTVRCNSNEKVTGGGAIVLSLSHKVRLVESFAVSDTMWQVAVYNTSGSLQEIRVRAICATGIAGYERRWERGFALPPGGTTTQLTVNCPAGKRGISGGFQIQAGLFGGLDQVKASASIVGHPVGSTGWMAKLRNDHFVTMSGSVQTICTSLDGWGYDDDVSMVLRPGETGWRVQDCGSDEWLVGGGWDYGGADTPFSHITAGLPTNATNDYWKINAVNPDSVNHSFFLVSVCLLK